MTKKAARITATTFFLLYISSLVFLGIRVRADLFEGAIDARIQFDRIASETEKISTESGFMTYDFVTRLKSVIIDCPSVISVVVANDESTFFAYPLNSEFITAGSKGQPVLQSFSPQVKVFNSSVFVDGADRVTVSSAIYTILPYTVFKILLYVFLALSAVTLAALVCAVLVSVRLGKTGSGPTGINRKAAENTPKPPAGIQKSAENSENTLNPPQDPLTLAQGTNSVSFSVGSDTQKSPEISELTDDSFFEDEIQSIISDFSDEPVQPPAAPEENGNVNDIKQQTAIPAEPQQRKLERQQDPMGLFSPKTGLGWESYLETRLDAELIRSASGEQDLALCIIRIAGLDHTMPASRRIADILYSYFNFRDLLFEYKNDGYTSVNYSMDTNQAMVYAEKIIVDVRKILSEYNLDYPVGIGISTRSQRLVTGARLITEAEVALQKAFEERDLPIVAFKVNTEKYHQFVSDKLHTANVKKN